jgi:site-specific DNA-cytosine methylase
MEEIPAARGHTAGWLAMFRDRGYAAKWDALWAKKYGVPQRRQRFVFVARKGEEPPGNFPPAPSLEILLSAGEALCGCDEGRAITGAMLESVRTSARRDDKGASEGYGVPAKECVLHHGP